MLNVVIKLKIRYFFNFTFSPYVLTLYIQLPSRAYNLRIILFLIIAIEIVRKQIFHKVILSILILNFFIINWIIHIIISFVVYILRNNQTFLIIRLNRLNIYRHAFFHILFFCDSKLSLDPRYYFLFMYLLINILNVFYLYTPYFYRWLAYLAFSSIWNNNISFHFIAVSSEHYATDLINLSFLNLR